MAPLRITFRVLLAVLSLSLLATGCLSDPAEPTIAPGSTPLPGTAIALPTSTPAPLASPTLSRASWLPPLLDPGPPGLVAPALFFLHGPDAWLIDGDLAARQVTEQRRVRAVETVPGAPSAAVLLLESAGGRETEEVRVIDADGNVSEPLYGPEIVGDPAGNPRVRLMRWSPDGQRLALVREDNSIWLTTAAETGTQIELPQAVSSIEDVRWDPSGTALAILHRAQGNAGVLRLLPVDGDGSFDLLPLGSFGAVCWPPDRGRLVVSEDRSAGRNPNAGSLFAVEADGSGRELLIGAGEFGPAIRIGLLQASPDGTQLAFTVEAPDTSGDFRFQALYVHELASGVRRRLEVASGYAVTDLWWFERGLAWRALDPAEGSRYSGVEPFVIEFDDVESGTSHLLYTSDGT